MKTIQLKKTTLTVHPRTAFDVLSAGELSKRDSAQESPASLFIFIIHSSLKRNLEQVPWYRVFKRLRIRKLISLKSLVVLLSLPQMERILAMIHEVEEFPLEVHNG